MKARLILLIAAAMLFTAGCTANESAPAVRTEQEAAEMINKGENMRRPTDTVGSGAMRLEYSKEKPLFVLVETQDEAEKIAADYGIELVDFASGVASYYTDKDPAELIKWGEEQGFPPLEINYMSYTN